MAGTFVAASSHSLIVDSTPVTAAPFTVSLWFQVNDVATTYDLLSIGDKDVSNDHLWQLRSFGTQAGDPLAWRAFVASQGQALSSSAITAGEWHHAMAVEAGAADRTVYLNGGNSGTNTTSRAPLNADRVGIGVSADSSPSGYTDGMIAEVAIWNVALTAAEAASLAKGASPLMIRPDALVFYDPMVRNLTRDYVGGLTLTNSGATVGVHPRIIHTNRRLWIPKVAATFSHTIQPTGIASSEAIGTPDIAAYVDLPTCIPYPVGKVRQTSSRETDEEDAVILAERGNGRITEEVVVDYDDLDDADWAILLDAWEDGIGKVRSFSFTFPGESEARQVVFRDDFEVAHRTAISRSTSIVLLDVGRYTPRAT